MENAMSFQDVIKKSVLEAGQFLQPYSWSTVGRAAGYIFLALVAGLLLYWLYRKTYAGVVYSRSFAASLVGMTVLTCAIIVTIQSNVVLSLGMVGALSIVRYRTAIKDPMDLLYLFWAVADGIAIGAGMFYIALLLMLAMSVLLLCLKNRRGTREEMYILLVHYDGDGVDEQVRRSLGTCRYKVMSKTLRKRDVEMAIEVRIKHNNLNMLDALRTIEGVTDATLVQYSGDYID
ncbi:MAG: DUF4956 domain-containing protein [Clostridia bacterium]